MKITSIEQNIQSQKLSTNIVMVQFKDVEYHYAGDKQTLRFHLGPMNLEIRTGELLGVLGPSGSGKTTLLRLIAGLETPSSGVITIDGQKVFGNSVNVLPEKRQVGMMFQDHALFPHLTVRKNILFGIRYWARDDRERRVFELEDLLALKNCLNRFPHELSGGQQQRVALARTLAPKPKVVLLDEPLSSVDADLRGSLAQELKQVLKQTKTTAVWVTHDQTEVLDLADRVLVLHNGQIEQIDTPWNLYNKPKNRFVGDFIGHAIFINGELRNKSILTEIGSIDCPPCLQYHTDKLKVMLRPDDIQASPHDAGLGTVVKRQFFGANQLYSIRLPSGQQILSNQPPHVNWPIGTKLRIGLDIKSIVAFPVR